MLYRLGYGLSKPRKAEAVAIKQFTFTSALPSEFTYTRSGTQTVRNSSGQWVSVAANTAPFDHNAAGTALGLRFEPSRTNKITQRNFAPTDTTGLNVISGSPTISCVDYAPVTSATIRGSSIAPLSNGKAIKIQTGGSSTIIQIGDQAGNTNAHSWRVCLAAEDLTNQGNVGFSDGVSVINFQPLVINTFYEITLENFTPNSSIRYLRLSLQAGKTVYLIGTQLEEGAFLTSPIVTDGANATRNFPVCVATGIGGGAVPWFDNAQGSIVGEFKFEQLGFDAQYAFMANEGTGLTNAMGMYSSSASGQVYPRDIIASTNNQIDQVHCPILNKRMPLAITWRDGESTAVAGPMRFERRARPGSPTGMDRIYVGGRPFNQCMCGWVKSLTVMNKYRSLAQLAVYMFPSDTTYKAIISGGQSNKHGYYRSQVGTLNSGEAAGIAQMNLYWTGSENWMINGAENGSFLVKADDPNAGTSSANWWYDPTASGLAQWGPRMADWEEMARAFGVSNIYAIDWDQGESDTGLSVAEFKAATLAVFNRMREIIGTKPVFMTGIGRRSDTQNTGYNTIRQVHRELASENAWIYRGPEKFTQALADVVHVTDAGYGVHAVQHLRKILSVLGESVSGVVNPPTMVSASRSGTAVTVTLSAGDFTPSSAIEGFKFFANGSEISISAAVRTNSTTITLTLASTPSSGPEVLYYGYGSLIEVNANYTNLVKDNSAYTLSLMSGVITL